MEDRYKKGFLIVSEYLDREEHKILDKRLKELGL